jgi:organic hydroperoxide reductase OsmC/OhrA
VSVRAKEFRYDASIEDGGRMFADGTAPLEPGAAWTADHLLVAALLRCSLESLSYHAARAGLESSGRGDGFARVTKRESDGRFAIVEVEARLDVALEPDPGDDRTRELLLKAERDCFVGASLTAQPRYAWRVNGRDVAASSAPSARAAPSSDRGP